MDGGTDSKSLKHFIAGQWVDAAAGAMFEVFNPLDDSHYAFAAKGTTEDIFNAVAAAKAALHLTKKQRQPSASAGSCGSQRSWKRVRKIW